MTPFSNQLTNGTYLSHAWSWGGALVVGWLVAGPSPALADIFHLKEGGQVVGTLVERGEHEEYVVATRRGGTVTLAKSQVEKVERQDEKQVEYERRSRSLPNTVPAHRAMADWCKKEGLSSHNEHHLRQIVALDPNDHAARTSLGYQQFRGRWQTREEVMADRGLTFYDGKYRTGQEIALLQREKEQSAIEASWTRNINLWKGWLGSRRAERAAEAYQLLDEIEDPSAAPALINALRKESDEGTRELFISILGRLDHPAAMRQLIQISIHDHDPQMREFSLEHLLLSNRPIQLTPYVKALRNKNNEIVLRAAEALEKIGDPDAISPLIDALVTRHKFAIDAAPGNMAPTFFSDGAGGGGGGLNMGGPKTVDLDVENVEVRHALVVLSGNQDFGFNQSAWRHWFVSQTMQTEHVDTRRDK